MDKSSLATLWGVSGLVTALIMTILTASISNIAGAQAVIIAVFSSGVVFLVGGVILAISPVESIPYGKSKFTNFFGLAFVVASLVWLGLVGYNLIATFGAESIVTPAFATNLAFMFVLAFIVTVVVMAILFRKKLGWFTKLVE